MAESSSSEEDTSSDEDEIQELDDAEIKLAQMRRGAARAKGGAKTAVGFKGLQSYEDMMKEHALIRMQEGMKKLLMLHTGAELSSISGVLGMSVKEKPSTSLKQIIDWASVGGQMTAEKVISLLSILWEGALFEYLRLIGHPVHTMFCDPKETVLHLWQNGGLLEGTATFVPHFIVREVKKRYEWVKSADIAQRLDVLRDMQDKAKKAEQDVVSHHDYNNILGYFHKMGDLRKEENNTRDYIIGELEIARSRIDSNTDQMVMLREDLAECERQFVTVTELLNDRLGYSEMVAEMRSADRWRLESDLQRLALIVDSYIEADTERQESGGGSAQASSLRHAEESCVSVRAIHTKLQAYRDQRDACDEALRERTRDHVSEIDRLEAVVRDLEARLEFQTRRANR